MNDSSISPIDTVDPGHDDFGGLQRDLPALVSRRHVLTLFGVAGAAGYAGRWPHCHFEVYAGIDDATAGKAAIKTSPTAPRIRSPP